LTPFSGSMRVPPSKTVSQWHGPGYGSNCLHKRATITPTSIGRISERTFGTRGSSL
jgi:hypothetical protein